MAQQYALNVRLADKKREGESRERGEESREMKFQIGKALKDILCFDTCQSFTCQGIHF
jgi:hypothetical protein